VRLIYSPACPWNNYLTYLTILGLDFMIGTRKAYVKSVPEDTYLGSRVLPKVLSLASIWRSHFGCGVVHEWAVCRGTVKLCLWSNHLVSAAQLFYPG